MSQLLTTAVLHTLKHSAACLHPGVPLLKFWGNIIALHCDLCDMFMQTTKTFQNPRFSKGIAFTAWKPWLKPVESRGAQITGAAISVLHLGVLLSPRVVMLVVERLVLSVAFLLQNRTRLHASLYKLHKILLLLHGTTSQMNMPSPPALSEIGTYTVPPPIINHTSWSQVSDDSCSDPSWQELRTSEIL